MKPLQRKPDKDMKTLIKRKSYCLRSRCGNRALELIADLGPDRPVDRRMRAIRLALDDRGPAVGGGADRHMQRYLAEERHGQTLGFVARAAMAENIRLRAAMRALEITHILDDAEHGHVDLLEHRQSAPRIDQR